MAAPVPFPPPKPASADGEDDEAIRIRRHVEEMLRQGANGAAYEERLRKQEAINPKYLFLDPMINAAGHGYYRWRLFCERQGYTAEQVCGVEAEHSQRLRPAAVHGTIDLTADDRARCLHMLQRNTGTKDAIKELRTFVLQRAHSAVAVGAALLAFTASERANAAAPERAFRKLLHTLYVINDVVFNHGNATTDGPYTRVRMKTANGGCMSLQSSHRPLRPPTSCRSSRRSGRNPSTSSRCCFLFCPRCCDRCPSPRCAPCPVHCGTLRTSPAPLSRTPLSPPPPDPFLLSFARTQEPRGRHHRRGARQDRARGQHLGREGHRREGGCRFVVGSPLCDVSTGAHPRLSVPLACG